MIEMPGERGALLSEGGEYRYLLWRRWDLQRSIGGMVAFVGLNPSTADAIADDHTIRVCRNRAKKWGFGGMCMLNLYAVRSKDPNYLRGHPDAIGERCDEVMLYVAQHVGVVVACWGSHTTVPKRASAVCRLLRANHVRLHHCGCNQDGQPCHPRVWQGDDLRPHAWNH